ncbi:MAG: ATP-binding protein [Candidatus Woesearchaeota archaeon]|nr:ATP-binding protein [Candidatus Woesearchaeota archaeon]
METNKLEEFNHWWIKRKVDTDLALPFKREIYQEIEKQMDKRFIIALVGLRRIGKTTTVYQLIEELIDSKIDPTDILFFSFDENRATIGEILDTYREMQKKDFREKKVYVFLDEIQKCTNWENEIKKYYDLYPKLKFIISGSESLFIKRKTKETLAGRIVEFILMPFTFKEYLQFKNIKEEEWKYETKMNPIFLTFAERGGFPETFSLESEKDFKEYIRTLVVDKIVYKDIPRLFRLEDPEFLRVLLELIATNPGMYLDYQSLSKQFGKDRRVIKDYISYLKESFLILILGNYRKGSMATLRKIKRAYPADTSFIFMYKTKMEEGFYGRVVETLVVNKMRAGAFWKNGHEIDIIADDMPIEIKYQEKIRSEDYKPVLEFMRKFKKKEGIIISKHEEGEIKFAEGTITLIPAWKWMLRN